VQQVYEKFPFKVKIIIKLIYNQLILNDKNLINYWFNTKREICCTPLQNKVQHQIQKCLSKSLFNRALSIYAVMKTYFCCRHFVFYHLKFNIKLTRIILNPFFSITF